MRVASGRVASRPKMIQIHQRASTILYFYLLIRFAVASIWTPGLLQTILHRQLSTVAQRHRCQLRSLLVEPSHDFNQSWLAISKSSLWALAGSWHRLYLSRWHRSCIPSTQLVHVHSTSTILELSPMESASESSSFQFVSENAQDPGRPDPGSKRRRLRGACDMCKQKKSACQLPWPVDGGEWLNIRPIYSARCTSIEKFMF
jgi:hypothetical protein